MGQLWLPSICQEHTDIGIHIDVSDINSKHYSENLTHTQEAYYCSLSAEIITH